MATLSGVLRRLSSNRHLVTCTTLNVCAPRRRLSYAAKEYDDVDPAPCYFDESTQRALKLLTRIDPGKVYKRRRTGAKKLEQPVYKFMTDAELKEAIADAHRRLDELIQMPPVVALRRARDTIHSNDPALIGFDTAKFVFTDISFGVKNSDRLIVVRDPADGTLRDADWSVRDRVNQLYFPLHGRSRYRPPQLFDDDRLANLLDRKEYVFLLDKACIEFEPDSRAYQRATSVTYQCVDERQDFDALRSTRHFGPLAFFLVWFARIDNLLLDVVETMHADEAVELIRLYASVHRVAIDGDAERDVERLVADYGAKHATKRAQLELAMRAFAERREEARALERAVQTAHGRA